MGDTSTKRIRFPGSLGLDLGGILEIPEDGASAWAVIAPCFTCLKDSKAIVYISRALAASGWGVLRYDVTGIGDSDGDFAETTLTSEVGDLNAAIHYLEEYHQAPRLVMGISLGGAVAVLAASGVSSMHGMVAINAPSDTLHLRDLLKNMAPEALAEGVQEIEIIGKRVRIGRALIEDLEDHDILKAVGDLNVPILIAHAPEDEIVDVENGERLFAKARQPKCFVPIAGSDHLMLRDPSAPEWVAEMIATWAARSVKR